MNPGTDEPVLLDHDLAMLRFVRRTNTRLRAVLCTLARRGVAIRQTTPRRARAILDALAPWPFYKGGQFLFDLLEWEDLMIDGDPPPALSHAELTGLVRLPMRWLTATVDAADPPSSSPLGQTSAAMNLPMRWLAATASTVVQGALRDLGQVLAPPTTTPDVEEVEDVPLPPLESGFYLYEDVVLGLFDLLGPLAPASPADPAEPSDPTEPSEPTDDTTEPEVTTAVFPIRETFEVTDVEHLHHDWTLLGDAVLTAECGLRLTPNDHDKAGTALLNTAFPSSAGVSIEFDYCTSAGGADGFAVYLVDGAHESGLGGYGGGLGYSRGPDGNGQGVPNGYLGIGFDTYGNFSTALAGPVDHEGPGQPNHIVLRGSGDRDEGFRYLDGVAVKGGLAASWDDQAHVRVTIVNAVVTVVLTRGGKSTTVFDGVDLKEAPGQAAMPATFKLGLSASTGGVTAQHCLRNLVIAMPTEMPLRVDGPEETAAGRRVSYAVTVRNNGPNEATDAAVTGTLDPAPAAVEVAVTSTEGGAQAGRARTGTGTFTQPLVLPVGAGATITVTAATAPDATGEITCAASVDSVKNSNTAADKSASRTTRLTADAPRDYR